MLNYKNIAEIVTEGLRYLHKQKPRLACYSDMHIQHNFSHKC